MHSTPLYSVHDVNIAVHIRRGDMVFRNFHKQLSPDSYFANAMWHVLATASAEHAASVGGVHIIFHVFSEHPPASSWTGGAKVQIDAEADYVDELGCASSLHAQLLLLAGDSARWEVRCLAVVPGCSSWVHRCTLYSTQTALSLCR